MVKGAVYLLGAIGMTVLFMTTFEPLRSRFHMRPHRRGYFILARIWYSLTAVSLFVSACWEFIDPS